MVAFAINYFQQGCKSSMVSHWAGRSWGRAHSWFQALSSPLPASRLSSATHSSFHRNSPTWSSLGKNSPEKNITFFLLHSSWFMPLRLIFLCLVTSCGGTSGKEEEQKHSFIEEGNQCDCWEREQKETLLPREKRKATFEKENIPVVRNFWKENTPVAGSFWCDRWGERGSHRTLGFLYSPFLHNNTGETFCQQEKDNN